MRGDIKIMAVFILALSTLLQYLATAQALYLIRITGKLLAWLLIAAAVFLMAIRRSITLYRVVFEDGSKIDASAEFVALTISILMVAGISYIGRYFRQSNRSEQALQQRNTELETILDAAQDILFILKSDGTITSYRASDKSDLYVAPEEFLGKKMQNTIPSELGKQYEDALATIAETGAKQTIEYQLKVPDANEQQWYEALLSPNKQQIILVIRNITNRKHSEVQRMALTIQHERVELLEEIISDLSHDLKTPLSSMKTLLHLLKRQNKPEKQQEYLSRMDKQINRLAKLVEDILTMSRLDKGVELQFAPLNLNELIENISNLYHEHVMEKKLDFTFDLRAEFPLIVGNENELSRALANLIENAINYTPNGKSIVIKTYSQDREITCEIQDTGIGISADDLPHIFDRFYRVDKALNIAHGGTGLGLAIVKKIIELHGGEIEIESILEEGSIFRITLPSQQNRQLIASDDK
jgi:signal transduction histidine kinase